MIKYPSKDLKVELCPLSQSHLAEMFIWRNDELVRMWCRQHDLIDENHHISWFQKQSSDQSIKMYAIHLNQELGGTFIGVCGFTSIDLINQRAEFSLYIDPKQQSRGYGENALKLLCWHGFNSYPFNIIWGESFDLNPAIKVFEKTGFKKEGTRRAFYFRNGSFVDAHLFSIKSDELVI